METRFRQYDETQLRMTVERFGDQLDSMERRIGYLRAKQAVSDGDIVLVEQRVAEFRTAVAAATVQRMSASLVEHLQSLQDEIDELLGRAENKQD